MTIAMNWHEVGLVADDIRTMTDDTVTRLNQGLTRCGETADANPGFDAAAALRKCQDSWAAELSDLVRRTMVAADKLDDSALTIEQAEQENTRAAAALKGLR